MTTGNFMKGKRGLIMGVANDKSIAWGISKAVADQGAELAFTYQGEALQKRVGPLAESVGSNLVLECDVRNPESIDAVFAELEKQWAEENARIMAEHPPEALPAPATEAPSTYEPDPLPDYLGPDPDPVMVEQPAIADAPAKPKRVRKPRTKAAPAPQDDPLP